jgi:hypothetical protein
MRVLGGTRGGVSEVALVMAEAAAPPSKTTSSSPPALPTPPFPRTRSTVRGNGGVGSAGGDDDVVLDGGAAASAITSAQLGFPSFLRLATSLTPPLVPPSTRITSFASLIPPAAPTSASCSPELARQFAACRGGSGGRDQGCERRDARTGRDEGRQRMTLRRTSKRPSEGPHPVLSGRVGIANAVA